MNEDIDWDGSNIREMKRPPLRNGSRIDEEVSRAVVKPVLMSDPRLLKLIVQWKQKHAESDMRYDGYMRNPDFLVELKQVFND